MANTTKAYKLPENEVLDLLFQLAKSLSFIPTRTFMENIELPSSIDKQIEVGNILLKMPAYDIYIERFGNWLKCLTLSGILENGHKQTIRGIQCLANDGHLCLSLGEKAIDDWLSTHRLEHEKEVYYPYDEVLNPNRLSRADWRIGNIYIEYAGLMDDNEYARKMEVKIRLAEKHQLKLIVIEPAHLLNLDEQLNLLLK